MALHDGVRNSLRTWYRRCPDRWRTCGTTVNSLFYRLACAHDSVGAGRAAAGFVDHGYGGDVDVLNDIRGAGCRENLRGFELSNTMPATQAFKSVEASDVSSITITRAGPHRMRGRAVDRPGRRHDMYVRPSARLAMWGDIILKTMRAFPP